MYTKAKYVVGRTRSGSRAAIIGPEDVNHVDLAQSLAEVHSAGFCHYSEEDVKVYGKSVGLNLECNEKTDKPLVGRAMSHPNYYS
jgi:hypothetical protein